MLGVGVATSFVEAAGCHPEAHEISDPCPDFVLQNGHNYNIGGLGFRVKFVKLRPHSQERTVSKEGIDKKRKEASVLLRVQSLQCKNGLTEEYS